MFDPRQEIFDIVFHYKINLFKVTRHFLCFISNLFHLRWTNAFKYCYYHPTPWEELKSYLPFDVINFILILLQSTRTVLDEKPYNARQLLVYFQKYTLCRAVFYHIVNALPCFLKDVDIIFFVFNQLKSTTSVNFRMLILPYDSL